MGVITRPAVESDYNFLLFLGVPRNEIKDRIESKLEASKIPELSEGRCAELDDNWADREPAYGVDGPWLYAAV